MARLAIETEHRAFIEDSMLMKRVSRLAATIVSGVLLASASGLASGRDDPVSLGPTVSGRAVAATEETTKPIHQEVLQRPVQPEAGRQPPGPAVLQGLSKGDRALFFHAAEGSELIPLAWVKALRSVKTARPFLELTERFGLMPDHEDAAGRPIGVTAAMARGAEILGPMVGVNCAACHTSALTCRGREYPLLGAPNLFDLNAFYQELFASLLVTLGDEKTRSEFTETLVKQAKTPADLDSAILAQQLLTSVAALSKLSDGEVRNAERLFRERLLGIVQEFVAEVGAKARGAPPSVAAVEELSKMLEQKVSSLFHTDVLGFVAVIYSKEQPDQSALATLPIDDPRLRELIGRFFETVRVKLSLFRARLRFLKDLEILHQAQRPLPGPGRIDAFTGIRDLVFPRSDVVPASAPVSYPHLWLLNQTYWWHWDGNTNTLIERNVGQALGQGAAFEQPGHGAYHSTVRPEDIHRLEETVRRLSPPEWPASILGPIDPAKAARGQALYQNVCARCHVVTPPDGHAMLDALEKAQSWASQPAGQRGPRPVPPEPLEKFIPAEKVGTDPARAMNFAINVGRQLPLFTGGTEFTKALGDAAWNYSRQSYDDHRIPRDQRSKFDWPHEMISWRTTRCYVARPLLAIWATAPYLHNGSVPTLYHLLLPARERPRLFPVGHREYDPVKLGHVVELEKIPANQLPVLFEFNTTMSGNSNAGHEGHEYGTDLSDSQRLDLLEYLKAL
jgi:mono/diheme cytochrome c family protein